MVLATLKTTVSINAEPLTPAAFAPFGAVISSQHSSGNSTSANYGTATKLFKLSPVINNYDKAPSHNPATANFNLFRCSPPLHLIHNGVYSSKVLERHPFSTQTFLPMGRPAWENAYMVIVAPDDSNGMPELSGVRAYICRGDQAVTYGAATWHAPMIALGSTTDFAVLIHENGVSEEDCEEVYLDTLSIDFEPKPTARKPQSEDEFNKELGEFHASGPNFPSAYPADYIPRDGNEVIFKAQRQYYEHNWAAVVDIVDPYIAQTTGKLQKDLEELRACAQQHMSEQ